VRQRSSRRLGVRGHARVGGILVRTLDLPGSTLLSRSAAFVEEEALNGWPTTVIRPSTPPPWPAVLFANGATPDGRAHPGVQRLGLALAGSGHVVFIPDLPGIATGEMSPRTLTAAAECVSQVVDSDETERGRVGLVGVSVGGTLALLVAASPDLAARISVVACVAPFTDLEKVMMLATTETYPASGGPEPYAVPASLPVGLARSLIAMLSPTPDARALRHVVERLDPRSTDPLSALRDTPCQSLGPAAAAAQELLINCDPGRFPSLYAALPEPVQQAVASLSPLRSAAHLLAPIEIATAPRDAYFPVAESLALASVARNVRVTVTTALAHAVPTMSFRSIAGVARLHGFFARALAATSRLGRGGDEPVRWR
jgi:pimeloyl-ACP methyl ester carboxylesterase